MFLSLKRKKKRKGMKQLKVQQLGRSVQRSLKKSQFIWEDLRSNEKGRILFSTVRIILEIIEKFVYVMLNLEMSFETRL